MERYKRYKKDLPYSYCFGPYPSISLIETRPDLVREVLISNDLNEKEKLIDLLDKRQIPYRFDDKTIARISDKKKEYLVAVFDKFPEKIEACDHIILEGVDNCGNLGTIIRSMLAFGYKDLVLVGPCCDLFNPKTVRASMGAIFKLGYRHFESLADYKKVYPNTVYSFLLNDRAEEFSKISFKSPYALAFGNEGAGLSEAFQKERAVFISQSKDVDSLNLPNAATIALYGLRKN